MNEKINNDHDHLFYIKAGSGGTVIAAMTAAIQAGAKGIEEIPIEDRYQKINWTGSKLELLSLFEMLAKAGYISKREFEHAAEQMHHHFLNNHDEIKMSSVNSMKSQKYPYRRIELMDNILKRLSDAIISLDPEDSAL